MWTGIGLCALSLAGTVTMNGGTWRSLQPVVQVAEDPGATLTASDRTVTVSADGDVTRLRVQWTLRVTGSTVVSKRWIREPIEQASIRVDGRGVMLRANDGLWASFALGPGTHSVVLEGVLPQALGPAGQSLTLADAAISEVVVRTEDEPVVQALTSVRLGDRHWTSGPSLQVSTRPKAPKAARKRVVLGSVGMGLTVGEASVVGRARVRLKVQSGHISAVDLNVDGLGRDLQVTGGGLTGWSLQGDRLRVELGRDEAYLVELDLAWTQPLQSGDAQQVALPTIRPLGVLRTVSTVQLARDGEVEAVPQVAKGSAVASRELKEWGTGLVTGTTTASFAFNGPVQGTLDVLRFTPVSGPPTLVDVATVTLTETEEGRGLMRAHYAVRNDRSAHLRVTPPDGARLISARVAGRSVTLGRDGDAVLIPLQKSVETVEGLLAFPVEVGFLWEGDAWARREERSIALPRVDAPVALTRSTVVLPSGYADRGQDVLGRVEAFSEGDGIQYGLGSGESARMEVLMQSAVDAWMSNAFDEAQGYLDTLRNEGLDDENVERLQSNLDVISGEAAGDYDVALERRVRQQAQARADGDRLEQDRALKKAKRAKQSGDYETARSAYEEAARIGDKLDRLEQDESVENAYRNQELKAELKAAEQEALEAEELEEVFGLPDLPMETVIVEAEAFRPSGMVLQSDLSGGVGGLIGAKGTQIGAGGLGARGSGLGGGGSVDGLEGPSITGSVSGGSGYGRGGVVSGEGVGAVSPEEARATLETAVPQAARPPASEPAPASPPPLQVTSVQNTTVVPVIGESIRFEHRLLAADEPLLLDVIVFLPRRSP